VRVRLSPRTTVNEDGSIDCPFAVAVDQNEYMNNHQGYRFVGHRTNADQGSRIIRVSVVARHLGKGRGDYQIEGYPADVGIERKSKADLFQSVANRPNMIERLEMMSWSFKLALVVVEAEISEIRADPPRFGGMTVKSLLRSIQAWTVDYPTVHWVFLPGREAAEAWTFRMMEKWWERRCRPGPAGPSDRAGESSHPGDP
jgi:hypothetical protein